MGYMLIPDQFTLSVVFAGIVRVAVGFQKGMDEE